MKKQLIPRQYGKVKATSTPIRGYKSKGNKIYCLTCLCKDESILFDQTKPITKQAAFKENLTCEICGQPLCPPKHSKFLERVKNARRHRTN